MKLLLTSGGITNKTIVNKLKEMVGKDLFEIKVVFIPTAMNSDPGDKGWFIKILSDMYDLGFQEFDIVDISALEKKVWLPRLQNADVIYCNGGSNFHLARSIESAGFADEILGLLKTRVWVGGSSGGMIMSPFQSKLISQQIYGEDFQEKEDKKSLGLIDFHIIPHLNSSSFPKLTEESLRSILKDFKEKSYIIDDETAIAVEDGVVEVVTEGKYFILN